MRLKVSFAKWRPCCLGLNVLTYGEVLAVVDDNYKLLPVQKQKAKNCATPWNVWKNTPNSVLF